MADATEHPLQLAFRLRDRLDDPALPVVDLLVLLRHGEPGAWANPVAPLALMQDPDAAREGVFCLLRTLADSTDVGPEAMPSLLEQARARVAEGLPPARRDRWTARMCTWAEAALERAAPLVASLFPEGDRG